MQIVIDINENEFGIDIENKFQDFFKRLQAEIQSRLISNDTLVCGVYELETIEMFMTAFKNATLEREPRWILVSERYPRPDDEYKLFLVTDDKGKVSVQEFYLSLDEEPQPYFSGMTNVVAWMPLPNAYKEVDV